MVVYTCLVKQIWMMPPALFLFLIFPWIFLSTHVGLPELHKKVGLFELMVDILAQ